MPEPIQDPLELLRRAWSQLTPPQADPEPADEVTQAVLRALRVAWRELPVPAPTIPARLLDTRTRAPRAASRAPWVARAAAAALLAALGALLWRAGGGARPPVPPAARAMPAEIARATVVAADSERLELRSGNVRLVLLTPGQAPAGEPSR